MLASARAISRSGATRRDTSGYLPDGSWGGWVPLHFSGKGRWVAGEEPKEMDLVDGVWCTRLNLDKQLRWIEKNFQPGTKLKGQSACRRACGRTGARDEERRRPAGGGGARFETHPGRWEPREERLRMEYALLLGTYNSKSS